MQNMQKRGTFELKNKKAGFPNPKAVMLTRI